MPNHVINEVLLRGRRLETCHQYLLNAKGEFSFAVLLPLPINYWPGGVGQRHEEAFPGTHLDAARKTWGTKWDAYGGPTVEDTDEGVLIRFQSAWQHPRGWTCALFNTLECDISVKWLSEGGTNAHAEEFAWNRKFLPTADGSISFESMTEDPTWREIEIEEGSDLHRHLHKLLWGVEEFNEEEDNDE